MLEKHKSDIKPYPIYWYLVVGASIIVFIQTFSLLSPILLSFLLILLISLAFNPVILRMKTLTGGRKGPTGLIVAALIMIIALTGWALLGPLKNSVSKISDQLPEYWERLQKPLIKMEKQAVLFEEKLQAEVTTEMAQTAEKKDKVKTMTQSNKSAQTNTTKDSGSIRSSLSQMLQGMVGRVTKVAFNAAEIMIVLVTVFFGVTFTLTNPRPIFGAMFSVIPERHHGQALAIIQRIVKFVPSWAGGTLLGMITIGLLVFVLMWPILGLSDALVLGLIATIFEALPFVGPLLSAMSGLLLSIGREGMIPLWVILAYIAVQTLENNVILPLIMARSVKLHPVAVIFSMLLCMAAFGVMGVLVATPLVAIVDIVHNELYRKRFLPSVTDMDLDHLARKALGENQYFGK